MSGNLALVIDERGASLEIGTHDTIVLVHSDGRRERIGLRALGSAVLHGDVQLSTRLLQAMATHGVVLTVLPLRGRASNVGFTRMPDRKVELRHRQHLAYADIPSRLDLARTVVCAKLEAMAEFSRKHAQDAEPAFYRAMWAAGSAPEVSHLMGVEGSATVKHFEVLEALYDSTTSFRFKGRSRRPPLDEPNALMSLAYTLAVEQATQLVLRAGLDNQVGFLHGLHRDRKSLSLDLLEPARSGIDGWVHTLLVGQQCLKPKMFNWSRDGAVRLNKEGRMLFYSAWYRDGWRIAARPMRRLLADVLARLRVPSDS